MRTRIFSTPASGTPTATWQDGDATAGRSGALVPFSTAAGSSAGGGGVLAGPGSFVSAQFSLATGPAALYVALASNGPSAGVTVYLESYSNFAWLLLDTANLGSSTPLTANLPAAAQLPLLRVRVAVAGNASVQCVAILISSANATGGGGTTTTVPTTTGSGSDFVADLAALRAVVTAGAAPGSLTRGAGYTPTGATDTVEGIWTTRAGTDADAPPDVVRPNDFGASANAQVWVKRL